MQTIFKLKEQAVTNTPLLVFECTLSDGRVERWSTHGVTVEGAQYAARVLQHNTFEIQTASDQGVDGIPRISIVLANADSHFSEIERAIGWKGARLKVGFLFYDLRNDAALTVKAVIFQGICNPPDEIREATFRITATNRMNLQRLLLPQVRIQRRCPWDFPATQEQRQEATDGGTNGKYSRFYKCGYSAGVSGGTGALSDGAPFLNCGYTRADCQTRGMFTHFGGLEFVPPVISVRTYGDKTWHDSAVSVNAARYNDFVPLVYGTAWYTPPVVFARNDGNLTRMEVLLGMGEIQGVLKVLVNDVEIPAGVYGTNMTSTGWYNIRSLGTREGACNADFTDANGQPLGDPYGSMAYLSVVVPNRLNNGTSLPRVKVLAQGLKLPVYGPDGSYTGEQFSSNPAWILLDILRRTGWSLAEIDVTSFASAATYCDELIPALDIYGSPITLPRFQCNFVLQSRRSAGDLVRGVRNSARLLLSYGVDGALQLRVENTIADEMAAKPEWSNSTEPLNGGWPSYEFGDGSNGISGILRKPTGEPSVRVFSRGMADTPNRFTLEFQDALNEYQQDSYSLVDLDDVAKSGQEVSTALSALGVANYDQAGRLLKFNLDKSVRGNTYIEFDSSVKAFGVRAGDLITITYLKEGWNRQPFRVTKLTPGTNHRITTITAQMHDDAWYADSNGQAVSASGGRRQGDAAIGVPKPLVGTVLDDNGDVQFGVTESAEKNSDGTTDSSITVSFVAPAARAAAGPGIPMLSLATQIGGGGTLAGQQNLYYAISAADSVGAEGPLSFIVRAIITNDGSSVTLSGLSFAPGTNSFLVYRGSTPDQLYRIAADQPPAASFTDTGLPKQLFAPPDPNFDHANFYWRMELQPQMAATQHSATTAGNDSLQMAENRYRGMIARITRGRGAGQERKITANTASLLTVSSAWDIEPDATSFFAVAENGWKFGNLATTSPAQFTIPNRAGETVQILGRAANVNDVECAAELSTVTRWQIRGSTGGNFIDSDVPPAPVFGLGPSPQRGSLFLSAVSFPDFTNTKTISAATLTLHYWDELQGIPTLSLATAIGPDDQQLDLNAAGSAAAGGFIQIGQEVLRVDELLPDGTSYRVTRGVHGTTPAGYDAQTLIYALASKTVIAPFPPGFFGSSYSGSWTFPIAMPDVRVASAELFVTNEKGNSPTSSSYLTHNDDCGLRTLSGGQYSIQVDGYLAVDDTVAPPLVVDASHSVRDVYAILGKAADGPIQVQVKLDDAPYCTLSFATGAIVSNTISGLSVSPLVVGSKLTLSVLAVGTVYPGADLTVLIRL
jgi:hypothetical protein